MRRYVDGLPVVLEPNAATARVDGDRVFVSSARGESTALVVAVGDEQWVSYWGHVVRVSRIRPQTRDAGGASSGELRAPMPGQIVDVRVEAGQSVSRGATILVLEAMKTQQPLTAPFDGVVEEIRVKRGDQAADGQLLARVVPADGGPAGE